MKWYKLVSKAIGSILRLVQLFTGWIFSIIYSGHSEQLPPITNLLLLEPASSLAFKIRKGKLKSRDLVEAFISRINEINPIVNCIVDNRFEEALKEADEVDHLIQSKELSEEKLAAEKPFFGIPFTNKDSISTKGLSHVAGLSARKNMKGLVDADVIAKMKQAGGISLAVTNVSELCMWWESYNNVYGRTNNPYNTSRIVGGSSGGEAALLTSAGSVIGVGSDVGGSIRMPAFFNGIWGHKTSTGIIQNTGQLPLAEGEINTYLSTGPMCRYATDLIPMLKVLSGKNGSQLKLDTKVNLSSLKIYYTSDEMSSPVVSSISNEMREAQKKVLNHFQSTYGIKPKKVTLNNLKYGLQMWTTLMAAANAPSFAQELVQREGSLNCAWELVKWSFWCSKHTLPGIVLGLFEKASPSRDSEGAIHLQNMCFDLKRQLQEILGDDGILIFPTHPEAAPFHNHPIFKPFNFVYTAVFNILGFPVTQCPLGLGEKGLPIGTQIIASLHNDHLSLAVAVEIEKAFGGWVTPSAVI